MGRPRGTSKYLKNIYLPGQKFGAWTVNDGTVKFDKKSNARLACTCKCGSVHDVWVWKLENEKSTQCRICAGTGSYNTPVPFAGDVPGAYITRMIGSARSRTLSYNLSPQYLSQSYSEGSTTCALSGLSIDFKSRTASADRIDSGKGYNEDNIQWVHKTINQMKGAIPQDQFIQLCHMVAANNIEPKVEISSDYPQHHKNTGGRKLRKQESVKDFFDKREQQ